MQKTFTFAGDSSLQITGTLLTGVRKMCSSLNEAPDWRVGHKDRIPLPKCVSKCDACLSTIVTDRTSVHPLPLLPSDDLACVAYAARHHLLAAFQKKFQLVRHGTLHQTM